MSTGHRHIALLGAANSVHLQRWALALHARGRRVSVLSQQVDDALELPPGVDFVALPHRGRSGYLRNAGPLRRWLHAHRPDLLHAHYASGYGTTAMLAGWRPTLLSVWGSDVYGFPNEGPLKRWLLLRNLQFADGLASTSEAMASQVRRLWPEAGPIAITPFGVDLRRFAPQPRREGPFTIGTVKTLAHHYGVDTLIHAFALIAGESDAQLLLVGGGPQRSELQQLAVRLGVAPRVHWAGAVPHEQVPQWLCRLDVFVAASRNESFGVAVVEAMACGVPVVVSDAGGLPEVVVHGQSGLVVPRDQPQALAAALRELVRDEGLRERLAIGGRQRAVAEYGWDRCIDRMLDCQDCVIECHAAQGRRA